MKLLPLLLVLLSVSSAFGQEIIPLYGSAIPNAKPTPDTEVVNEGMSASQVSRPTLAVYLPPADRATGAAVIICPGGGYRTLVMKREGTAVAEAFTKLGIAAFVLKYRLPSDQTMIDKSIGPLQDAQRAIQLVRQRASEWRINPQQIGIMGFSAGGHLASTAGTHFQKAVIDNPSGIRLRPDFMILVYPVISFQNELAHTGSRTNLIGEQSELIRTYSNEEQVTNDTPPTFLTHGSDDTVVPVGNSLVFYQALMKHHIPAEMHIYAVGPHGYSKGPSFDEWFGRCTHWLRGMGLVK